MNSDAIDWYHERIAALEQDQKRNAFRFDVVAYGRLVLLIAALVLTVLTVRGGWGTAGWGGVGILVVSFALFVVVHRRLVVQRSRTTMALDYFHKGISRLEGKWEQFPADGASLRERDHGYALDLDLFGSGSLFQLLNDTTTVRGEKTLASWLSAPPAKFEDLTLRQKAVQEIAKDRSLREAVAVAGRSASGADKDIEPFVAWAGRPPSLGAGAGIRVLAWSVTGATVVLSLGLTPWWTLLIPYAVGFAVLSALGAKLQSTISAVTDRVDSLERYAELLTIVENHEFESEALKRLQSNLETNGVRASTQIARLARLVAFLDARRNGAFHAILGPALLWDLHWVMALERWHGQVGSTVDTWLQSVAELEALCSLSTFADENPDYAFAELSDGPIHFEAVGLGHPLIPRVNRVVNDVSLPAAGHVLLVTGSNMSGKSTLLRSIGLGAVLAMAGAPSCCTSLRMSVCAVRSSMRVEDSVRGGVSRFYAELQQVKRVCQDASEQPVLFLLDEIFHGTNSRERHIGARSVIHRLIEHGAIGAVSTHDVALAALTEVVPDKVHLVHFQEDIEDGQMVFDYLLRPGVVKSGNALRWMRHVGLQVDLDEPQDE